MSEKSENERIIPVVSTKQVLVVMFVLGLGFYQFVRKIKPGQFSQNNRS